MITRVGPPTAIDVKDGEFTLRVPLTESPPPEWVHFFRESPSEYTSMCHPKLIDVEGDALIFTSEERYFREWLRLIDKWIADANRRYGEHLEALWRREAGEREAERERDRRIQEATEKLSSL